MTRYKKGTFLNICSDNPRDWRNDFRRIEQLTEKDHLELWVESILGRDGTRTLRSMLSGHELIMHGPFIHLSLVSHVDSVNEWSLMRFHEAVELAANLGARVVTFHAGTYPVFGDREKALHQLAERFAPFVKSDSPIVTLENMPVRGGTARECLGKLDDLIDLESLLPDVRFTLDVGHCLQNGDDFESFLRDKSHRISDIHLHDAICGGKAHLALGKGNLDLVSLLRTLREVKFGGYVGLETITWKDTERSWRSWLDIERHREGKGAHVARAV